MLRKLVYNNETVQAKAIRQVWYDIVKFTDSNVEATELKDIADIAKVNARAIELVIGRRR